MRKAFILVLLILSVVLTACPSNPPRDFTLSLNPSSLTVQQGDSGTTQLTITPQNGFTGTVNLSLVDGNGNPVSGISLSPTNVSVTGSSPVPQDLTVNVAASVAPGIYNLQVRATSGSLTKTVGLSLTVTASGGGGGGGGGGGTTVTVKQEGNGFSLVYYRAGNGNWQSLILSRGQGTFIATDEYEVAALCDYDNTLNLFKASASYRNQVTFFCGPRSGITTRNVEFTITLPSSVGSVSPQNGDIVSIGHSWGIYNGTNPLTVNAWALRAEAGNVVITLHRPLPSSSDIPTTTPYGYKVVSLGANDTSVIASSSGWRAFTSTKNLSISVPVGFQGGAEVFHFSDAYLTPARIGLVGSSDSSPTTGVYSLLPLGGVYVGFYICQQISSSGGSYSDILIVAQDTGGNDWNPTPPAPWVSGQFSVNGDTLTFTRTDAKAFAVEFWGFAQQTGGMPLRLKIFVQATSGGNTTYQIPVVPGLDYGLINSPDTVYFFLQALVRDRGADFLDAPGYPTEAELSGIDVAIAQKNGTYSGSSYTLP